MTKVLLAVALLGSGLAAGGLVIASLGGAPLLLALPPERYVPVHQFLVTRFDPFMPVCLCTGLVANLALAVLTPAGAVRVLAAGATALLTLAVVVSLAVNVPINRWVSTVDPEALPADWERVDPRVRRRNWNLVRTALATTALLATVTQVTVFPQ